MDETLYKKDGPTDRLKYLWTFTSFKSQMLGSEMVPQAVPLHSPYAFVVYNLSSKSRALHSANHIIDLGFDAQEFHVINGRPFKDRHVIALTIFTEKVGFANVMA